MDVVYLTVPFKDKDIVKALGARWDGKSRQWFAPSGAESRFARWIKAGGISVDSVADPLRASGESRDFAASFDSSAPDSRIGASLSSVLFEASEAIRKALPIPRWLVAEVASIRTHPHSGHTYIELVEHDDSGREMAKANARIWSGNGKVIKRFEKETGGVIVEGMKMLLRAQADFSIQYGFGLTIEDIDPSWTLGEMQRKLREIRERLLEEGLLENNKHLSSALDFQQVVIVAPDGAAGLGDFMADADLLSKAGLCSFDFIPAVFEGANALPSLSAALEIAMSKCIEGAVDTVVIVRGGGAKTSLNWLNEYQLARLVCQMPVPVMVGVGHERDATILDEICCESFDTPSKVIGAITSRIVSNAKTALFSFSQVKASAASICAQAQRETLAARHAMESEARLALSRESLLINSRMADVGSRAGSMLREARSELDSFAREVIGLGPSAVLSRGYAVVEQDGATRGRIQSLVEGRPIRLRMSDGEATVFIQKEA
jgi:exodeoxyribonuclease VII large subunit